jgi:hypothetical protein
MTPAEAKQLIQALARGIDPETGEVLPADNPLNSPHVIRALFLAAEALDLLAHPSAPTPPPPPQPRPRPPAPGKAGKPWTPEEDQELATAFDAGTTVPALARAHQRTNGAITSRLIRLGRLQPDNNPAD